jgi:hypothetical protein
MVVAVNAEVVTAVILRVHVARVRAAASPRPHRFNDSVLGFPSIGRFFDLAIIFLAGFVALGRWSAAIDAVGRLPLDR